MLACIVFVCITHLLGVQGEFLSHLDDGWNRHVDEEYYDTALTTLEVYEYNDTCNCNTINSTVVILKKLPADTVVAFSLWQKAMGEFKQPTGLERSMPMCELMSDHMENLFGTFMNDMGFTEDDCPPSPGTYGNPAINPRTDLFPTMPGSSYMFIATFKSGERVLHEIAIFLTML